MYTDCFDTVDQRVLWSSTWSCGKNKNHEFISRVSFAMNASPGGRAGLQFKVFYEFSYSDAQPVLETL